MKDKQHLTRNKSLFYNYSNKLRIVDATVDFIILILSVIGYQIIKIYQDKLRLIDLSPKFN